MDIQYAATAIIAIAWLVQWVGLARALLFLLTCALLVSVGILAQSVL